MLSYVALEAKMISFSENVKMFRPLLKKKKNIWVKVEMSSLFLILLELEKWLSAVESMGKM